MVLVGRLVVDEFDGAGDVPLGPVDDAGGITTVRGDERTSAL
jgi:hypothetical protein